MRTLHGSGTLLSELLAVSGVTLSEAEEGLNSTLVVLVALDLDNHLLQAPDGLLTALLRHLALEVVVELVATGASLILVLLGNLSRQLLLACLEATLGVEASVVTGLAFVSTELRGVTGITRAIGVRSLVGIAGGLLDVLLADRDLLPQGLLEVTPRHVGVLVPGVVLSGSINLRELILGGLDLVGSVLGGISSNVTEKSGGIGQELPELTVGDQQGAQCSQAIKCVVAMLLGGILVDRCARKSLVSTRDLFSVPDEVLEKVALVLGEEQDLGLLNDLPQVANKLLALCRKLLGG